MTRHTYVVDVHRNTTGWIAHIPELGRSTPVRHLREIDTRARALITDVEPYDLDIRVHTPDQAQAHIDRSTKLFAEADQTRAEAAAEIRAAARTLKELDIPLRDIGILLGVSYQRAGQLTASRPS